MAKKEKYVYGSEFQSRCMFLELYPESHQLQIDNLLSSGWSFVGILHDKDTDLDGNLKKSHYHFVIEFDNPKLFSTVCNKLGFSFKKDKDGKGLPPYGEPCKRFKDCARYLVHKGTDDKYQYSVDELFGDDLLLGKVKQLLTSPDENTQMRLLLDIFDSYDGLLTFRTALNLALKYNLYSTFRRGGALLGKVIEEYQHDEYNKRYDELKERINYYNDKVDMVKELL